MKTRYQKSCKDPGSYAKSPVHEFAETFVNQAKENDPKSEYPDHQYLLGATVCAAALR
jgi:hypothetical protein